MCDTGAGYTSVSNTPEAMPLTGPGAAINASLYATTTCEHRLLGP